MKSKKLSFWRSSFTWDGEITGEGFTSFGLSSVLGGGAASVPASA